ncbi:MAG: hypothetical protein AB7O52_19575 [Planctomycetota bacterium]
MKRPCLLAVASLVAGVSLAPCADAATLDTPAQYGTIYLWG